MKYICNTDNNLEWQTITQAAKYFGRTRQALESLIKRGVIESKQMGTKNVMHVHIPTLQIYYSSKAVNKSNQEENQNISNVSLNLDLIATKSDNKRLTDLVARLESDLNTLKVDYMEEKKYNRQLQSELIKLTKEFHSILNKESGIMNWIKTKVK